MIGRMILLGFAGGVACMSLVLLLNEWATRSMVCVP